jgi:molybdate transport system substrate-binding protein
MGAGPRDATPHDAAPVRVLSPSAVHSSLEAIVEAHRERGGGEVRLKFETAPAMKKLLEAGERADIIVSPPAVMAEIVKMGKALEREQIVLGRAGVGVMVRDGQPLPDVSTTEALQRALLEADTIVHTRASSGTYVAQLLVRLGLWERIAPKTRSFHDAQETFTHFLGLRGRDIGFGGIPEIRRWSDRGLRLAGPLPADIQNHTEYAAALATSPLNARAARDFLRFLAGPEARAILTAHGVDP